MDKDEIIRRLVRELDWALANMHEMGSELIEAFHTHMAETQAKIDAAGIHLPPTPNTPLPSPQQQEMK